MKNVTAYKGRVIRIERMKSSANGNPRYALTIGNPGTTNQVTACTTPDSMIGYQIQNLKEDDRVVMHAGRHYGRLQIDALAVKAKTADL